MAQPLLQCIPVGPMQVNCFLLTDPDTQQSVIVDPGAEPATIIAAAEKGKPVAVLLTHGHFDHIGAVDEVCAQFGIPLYIHETDIPKLTDPSQSGGHLLGIEVRVHTVPTSLKDDQILSLGGMNITVLHTPGHSGGSCCFLLPEGLGLLSGDTLFDGGYGRTDIADGDQRALMRSLRRLINELPPMPAYPGHGSFTTAGRTKKD